MYNACIMNSKVVEFTGHMEMNIPVSTVRLGQCTEDYKDAKERRKRKKNKRGYLLTRIVDIYVYTKKYIAGTKPACP